MVENLKARLLECFNSVGSSVELVIIMQQQTAFLSSYSELQVSAYHSISKSIVCCLSLYPVLDNTQVLIFVNPTKL
jgi:hypothetical protein